MKKLLLFLVLLIGFNVSLLGQNVKLTESELETILSNQWEIEFAMMGSQKIGQMPGAKDFDFLFKKDGKFDLIEDDGTIRWKCYFTNNISE
jgi:outer membrane lipoprotein-sorting protein